MDGRFPFDANGSNRSAQLNSAAQVRAALGLPMLDESYYMQPNQQQRIHQRHPHHQVAEQQRDLQLRQALLREQMEQQLQEQQLRAIGEQLQDFPDLQQHYQTLLLNERLQRQRSGGLPGASGIPGMANLSGPTNQQFANAALLREQTALRMQREQANFRAYEEALLRQQQQRLQQQQQQLASNSFHEEMTPPQAQGSTPASILMSALSAQQQQQDSTQPYSSSPHELLSPGGAVLSASSPVFQGANGPSTQASLNRMRSPSQGENEHVVVGKSEQRPVDDNAVAPPRQKRKYTKRNGNKIKKIPKKRGRPALNRAEEVVNHVYQPAPSPRSLSPSVHEDYEYDDRMGDYSENSGLDAFAMAADIVAPEDMPKGTVEGLLQAAEDSVQLEGAAMVLTINFSKVEPWPETDDDDRGLKLSDKAAESVVTRTFRSFLPSLPEEPLLADNSLCVARNNISSAGGSPAEYATNGSGASERAEISEVKEQFSTKKPFPAFECPYPIDTWWPSNAGVRKERKSHGESSDEDDFADTMSTVGQSVFRANEVMIMNRLARAKEPGVLEKLPHCRIHRVRLNKNSAAPELVYCHQVTEIYPQDIMCCCSKCGTWRHAACGGHHKPYSVRETTITPFVAICDMCHEEQRYLEQFPQGHHRIDRQRMENIRRGLATSSVIRHSSYSKHGGTYKWPLGSVSATHIGGHTRSVHVRHDKAEKQWTDMASRLGRGFGYRQKERVRSRTKEFERLLLSVEDAEAFTDRHNILLFLQRDTDRATPAGFENQVRNIFDPADDDLDVPENDDIHLKGKTPNNEEADVVTDDTSYSTGSPSAKGICVRPGCTRRNRFDSQFCCDACGIVTLELDLLRTLHDAQDIHPSVLRH